MIVAYARWDAMDAKARERRAALTRTEKSCGPDAPMLASSSWELSFSRATVATSRSPGRARRKPLKPLRREGRMFRWTCGRLPCAFYPLHTGLWVRRAPGFPCALCLFQGESFQHPSGAWCREKAEVRSGAFTGMPHLSFRDAPLGAGPESILPVATFEDDHQHRGYGFRVRARARPGM